MVGAELRELDEIEVGSPDFYKLNLNDQEVVLEINSENFQEVINRMENKGLSESQVIIKLMHLRLLRKQRARNMKSKMDVLHNAPFDSSQVQGAKTIIKFIKETKLRRAK